MPDADLQRLAVDLRIALAVAHQRRAFLFRDLAGKNRLKTEDAQRKLIEELMKVFAHYEVREIKREAVWPTTLLGGRSAPPESDG